MGQRLNIEIEENDEVLANAYYHWSGYTSSALEITKIILNNLLKVNYENRTINAVKLLETTGAKLTGNEITYILKEIPEANKFSFEVATDRNEGLIAVSKEGKQETRDWGEARVTIDLTNKIVDFQAICGHDSKEEFEEAYESKCDFSTYEDINFCGIPFDEFDKVNRFVIGLLNKGVYGFQTKNDKVWGFIA